MKFESDAEAILNFIRTKPDDLAPRYIFADALDELGHNAAATLVRTHLDACVRPHNDTDRDIRPVIDALRAALAADNVFPAWPEFHWFEQDLFIHSGKEIVSVRRGLIDYYSGPLRTWVRIAGRLLRWHPVCLVHVGVPASYMRHYIDETFDGQRVQGPPYQPEKIWLSLAIPRFGTLGPIRLRAEDALTKKGVAQLLNWEFPQVRFAVSLIR